MVATSSGHPFPPTVPLIQTYSNSLSLLLAGAYLVPYLVLLIIIGIPLFFLELAVGQRIRRGSIGVWHYVCPRLGGIGFSSCIVSPELGANTMLEAEGATFVYCGGGHQVLGQSCGQDRGGKRNCQ